VQEFNEPIEPLPSSLAGSRPDRRQRNSSSTTLDAIYKEALRERDSVRPIRPSRSQELTTAVGGWARSATGGLSLISLLDCTRESSSKDVFKQWAVNTRHAGVTPSSLGSRLHWEGDFAAPTTKSYAVRIPDYTPSPMAILKKVANVHTAGATEIDLGRFGV
jgi:hypothetical protein